MSWCNRIKRSFRVKGPVSACVGGVRRGEGPARITGRVAPRRGACAVYLMASKCFSDFGYLSVTYPFTGMYMVPHITKILLQYVGFLIRM